MKRRIGVILLLVVLLAAIATTFLALSKRGSQKDVKALEIHKVENTSWEPASGDPVFVAVLGSDARSGPPSGGGGRCDAIHIVAINPAQSKGTILNFPRDSYVQIAGQGRDKINAACAARGSATVMVDTLRALTGIPIQYYAITEFTHFQKLINELGGVDVNVPYKMDDVASGAHFQAGPQRLDGGAALAFTRNRKDTPNGDFSRTENQGLFIIAALRKFKAHASDPHKIFEYVRAAHRNTDISVPLPELLRLGRAALRVDPEALANVTVPGTVGSAGGASVVFLNPGDVYKRVADDGIY